jgi:CheY-like chemotaxis protein
LLKRGITPDRAVNGQEALDMMKKTHYDLVLLDIRMPIMDGDEVTRLIRADSTMKQPFIVALTANSMTDDKAQFLEAGMNDYIAKPFKPTELDRVLALI